MSASEIIALLLSLITVLLGVIAFFLARMIGKLDGLTSDVHKIRQSFLLFRQRVSIMLGMPIEDDDDNLNPQTTNL